MKAIISSLFVLSFLTACCPCKNAQSDTTNKAHHPEPVSILIGSGGGFSGYVIGTKIDTNGTVSTWTAMPMEDFEPKPIGRLSREQLHKLYTIIDEDSLMYIDSVELGNMITSLTLTRGDQRNNMRWPGIETDYEVAPPQIQRFVFELRAEMKRMEKFEE